MERPVVTVKQGQLQGIFEYSVLGSRYLAFKGIPYAAPPVGKLRFKDPEPPASWEGIRDASKDAKKCIRLLCCIRKQYSTKEETFGEEDCLYLNVYIPNNIYRTRGNPVMVWIHGYVEGFDVDYHVGPDYLMAKDVILVSINYRFGALGFLNIGHEEASGNQGLKDQVAALKWIKENIEYFGGNPNNITVFGVDLGASSTHLLLLSPLSKGLFHKAILQSGTATCHWALIESAKAEINAFKLASILGNDSKDPRKVIEFLQTFSATEILRAQRSVLHWMEVSFLNMPFGPTIDENSKRPFLPCSLSQLVDDYNDIPIIIGCTSHEYIMFLGDTIEENYLDRRYADIEFFINRLTKLQDLTKMRQLTEQVKQHYFLNEPVTEKHIPSLIQCLGDLSFSIPAKKFVNDQRKKKKTPIYYYNFSYVGNQMNNIKFFAEKRPMMGASHTDELPYLFYMLFCKFHGRKPPANGTRDRKVLEILTTMWTNFAKTGNPTPVVDDYVTTIWEPATIDSFNYLDIGNSLQLLTVTDDDNLLKMFQNL